MKKGFENKTNVGISFWNGFGPILNSKMAPESEWIAEKSLSKKDPKHEN